MIYINITSFVGISEVKKDHSMIVIFFPNNFKFCSVKKNPYLVFLRK